MGHRQNVCLSSPQNPPALKCPICESLLQKRDYDHAMSQLEKALLDKFVQQHRKDARVFQQVISELKTANLKQVRMIVDNDKKQRKLIQTKTASERKMEKARMSENIDHLKTRHKEQLQQTRELYSAESEKSLGQLKADYESRLTELVKKYEKLAEDLAVQFEQAQDVPDPVGQQATSEAENGESAGKQDYDEKILELQRLKQLQLISQMIKEIAQKRETT